MKIDDLDKLIASNKKKLKKRSERNKKLLITILLILTALYIASQIYVYYWLPKIYQMTSEL